MLFTTFPSVVFAAEDSTSECEEFIDLACEIFPEYSDKIRGDSQYSNTNTRSSVHVELIESVSRAVSENEYITYAEYSNGAILLTDYSYSYYTTQNESYTSAGGTYASIDIIAACSGGDSFYSYF